MIARTTATVRMMGPAFVMLAMLAATALSHPLVALLAARQALVAPLTCMSSSPTSPLLSPTHPLLPPAFPFLLSGLLSLG